MVEYISETDIIFGLLADPTRRDILDRVAEQELTVSELASTYDMSLAAVSKHLLVMEQAGLITKRKEGKKRLVSLQPEALDCACSYLGKYRNILAGQEEQA